eukprot:4352100-Amphidinium_carterae.2
MLVNLQAFVVQPSTAGGRLRCDPTAGGHIDSSVAIKMGFGARRRLGQPLRRPDPASHTWLVMSAKVRDQLHMTSC